MVKKGLKVGDSFTDGNQTYRVKAILPDGNYISKRVAIGAETPSEKAVEEPETVIEEVDNAEEETTKENPVKRTPSKTRNVKSSK